MNKMNYFTPICDDDLSDESSPYEYPDYNETVALQQTTQNHVYYDTYGEQISREQYLCMQDEIRGAARVETLWLMNKKKNATSPKAESASQLSPKPKAVQAYPTSEWDTMSFKNTVGDGFITGLITPTINQRFILKNPHLIELFLNFIHHMNAVSESEEESYMVPPIPENIYDSVMESARSQDNPWKAYNDLLKIRLEEHTYFSS